MSPQHEALHALVSGHLQRRGRIAPEAVGSDYLLDVGGHLLQVRLDDAGRLHVSTMIFYNDGDAGGVLAEPIAEFNAFHLFAGGYCLLVDDQSLSIYVDQTLSVQRFDVAAFSAHLADFADRAVSCARWYGAEVAESEAAMEPRQAMTA